MCGFSTRASRKQSPHRRRRGQGGGRTGDAWGDGEKCPPRPEGQSWAPQEWGDQHPQGSLNVSGLGERPPRRLLWGPSGHSPGLFTAGLEPSQGGLRAPTGGRASCPDAGRWSWAEGNDREPEPGGRAEGCVPGAMGSGHIPRNTGNPPLGQAHGPADGAQPPAQDGMGGRRGCRGVCS